ncbi:hypothetical protein GOP47_0024558 [Adiantum capillus-veneris]|uniref:Ribosomal RNA-processing protein 43 n=1 Tax=Adiantum capillus-veneris TaxID=13818 RepID=A0A9D4U352_ADICA|nr:hypothetical protein GOP47_0024558 [Adiantum capillus-veneris]
MAKLEHGSDDREDVELEAFRRLYPSEFLQQFLKEGVRPDGRPLGRARSTVLSVGSLPHAEGSAMVKLGNTTMLAGVKLEVMPSPVDSPDEGRIAVEFQMPAICSPLVRPGRQSELEPVIAEQIKNALTSTMMVDLRELIIAPGKAAWMAYLDVYCLDADGSLLDAALLAAAAALADVKLPEIAITDDGKVFPANVVTEKAQTLKGKRLKLGKIPMALTCALHPKHILPDPTAEEEGILKTTITVLTDFSGQLVSLYKPGGEVLASTSIVQSCIALAKYRGKELQKIFTEAIMKADSDDTMDAD